MAEGNRDDWQGASLSDILIALQDAVQAVNNLNQTLGSVFPGATALSTTIPSTSSITFTSSQAAGFMSVVSSSGGTFKIAVYNT